MIQGSVDLNRKSGAVTFRTNHRLVDLNRNGHVPHELILTEQLDPSADLENLLGIAAEVL